MSRLVAAHFKLQYMEGRDRRIFYFIVNLGYITRPTLQDKTKQINKQHIKV